MDGGSSNQAVNYKKKSSTIDKRTLRAHRRSLDWKEQRNDEVNRRRNVDDMSPLVEDDTENRSLRSAYNSPNSTPTRRGLKSTPKKLKTPHNIKAVSRQAQFLKWKQERDLKRKIEAAKKKPQFKVCHVKHEKAPTGLGLDKTFKTGKPAPKKPAPPTKASKPALGNTKRPEPQVKAEGTGPSTRRSKKTTPAAAAPSAKCSTRSATKQTQSKSAEAQVPSVTPNVGGRVTRQTRSQTITAGKTKTASTRPTSDKKIKSNEAEKKSEVDSEEQSSPPKTRHTSKVTTQRGQSFAPDEFSFTAPANLSAYVFKPLSPNSAAKFLFPNSAIGSSFVQSPLPRRCSTPKFTGLINRGAHLSSQKDTEEQINETEEDTRPASQHKTPVERRSVRRSIRLQAAEDLKEDGDSKTTEKSQTSTDKEDSNNIESQVKDNSDSHQESTEKTQTPTRSVRLHNARLSISIVNDINPTDDKSAETESPESPTTSVGTSHVENAHSEKKSDCSDEATVTTTTAPTTPLSTPSRKKMTRRSLAKSITSPDSSEDTAPSSHTGPDEVFDSEKLADKLGEADSGEQEGVVSSTNQDVTSPSPVAHRTRKSMSSTDSRSSPITPAEFSSKRNTAPRRKSMAKGFKLRSPEEWVKVLQQSPMIEMNRRKPKLKTSPGGEPVTVAINFDVTDFLGSPNLAAAEDREDQVFNALDSFMELTTAPTSSNKPDGEAMEITESVEENKENAEPVTKTGSEQTGKQEHDVKYFRDLMDSERQRLNQLCKTWEGINEFGFELTEEVKGEIRTTVGQAQLLMDQRFKQFTGLVDNCEFSRGEKVTTCTDLQGFWDMIYFQVEDVDHKFEELRKRKEGNWAEEEIVESKKPGPKKKVSAKPVKSKAVGKSKFAAFRAQMVKQKKGESTVSENKASEDTVKVFDAGFFKVSSPQKTPSPHCAGGTPTKPAPPQKEVTVDTSVNIVTTETENTAPPQPNCQLDFSQLCTPVAANLNCTPRRRSYVPVVPSPLLCDITPSRAKRRRSYRNTPIPKKLMKTEDGSCRRSLDLPSVGGSDSPVTPKRRRSNSKRVSFGDALTVTTVSPDVSYSEDLEPDLTETITETEKQNKGKSVSFCETVETSLEFEDELKADEEVDLLSYTLPPKSDYSQNIVHKEWDDSIEFEESLTEPDEAKKEDDGVEKPKSALKKSKTPQQGRRKSARLSVHFANSPDVQDSPNKAPKTPYNKDSLVAKGRVRSSGSLSITSFDENNLITFESPQKENTPTGKSSVSRGSSNSRSRLATSNRKEVLSSDLDLITFTP